MPTGSYLKIFTMTVIALLAWFGLVLQWYLIFDATKQNHLPVWQEFIRYASFFTILTNLLVAISLTSILIAGRSSIGRFFTRPSVQSGIALYIAVVGITYSVALRHVWNPTGWQLVADRVLHDLVPILYILYWAFFVPKKSLQWEHPLWWLIYPALYLVYVLTRGSMTGKYPYHFIDRTILPWAEMTRNIAVLFLVFAILGFLMVGIKKIFQSR